METGVKEVELRDLWRRYKDDGDGTARERLVVAYSPMVKFVAGRLGAGLPSHVEDADLISYGLVGLIGAIERFEPERGIKFETFAMTRIRGADHRRTALARLGAALGPLAGARDRGRPGQTRARTAAGADRGRAGGEAEHDRGGTAELAAGDRQLLGLRARRALDRLRLLRRPGLAAGHDRRRRRRRPAGGARHQRGQGPPDRGDRLAARARAARRRPLLLREPDPARDRRGPRCHRVARLPAAHQGRDAAEVPARAGVIAAAADSFELAVTRFNASEAARTVAGLTRTLGEPRVSIGPPPAQPTRPGSPSPGSSPGTSGRSTSGERERPIAELAHGTELDQLDAGPAVEREMAKLTVNVDGGARGNPGPAAIGAVVRDAGGEVLEERGERIGRATNNVAEYRALLLDRAAAARGRELELVGDSELIVRQVEGRTRSRTRR